MRKWILGILGAGLIGCNGGDGAVAQTGAGAPSLGGQTADAARPVLDQSVVDACRACHRDELSLAGRNPETLAATIARMADGSVAHVSAMPTLSDEDRAALARALSSGL